MDETRQDKLMEQIEQTMRLEAEQGERSRLDWNLENLPQGSEPVPMGMTGLPMPTQWEPSRSTQRFEGQMEAFRLPGEQFEHALGREKTLDERYGIEREENKRQWDLDYGLRERGAAFDERSAMAQEALVRQGMEDKKRAEETAHFQDVIAPDLEMFKKLEDDEKTPEWEKRMWLDRIGDNLPNGDKVKQIVDAVKEAPTVDAARAIVEAGKEGLTVSDKQVLNVLLPYYAQMEAIPESVETAQTELDTLLQHMETGGWAHKWLNPLPIPYRPRDTERDRLEQLQRAVGRY